MSDNSPTQQPDNEGFLIVLTIDGFAAVASQREYLLLENLSKDKVLKIHTAGEVYLIALVDRKTKLVAIQGGDLFRESELVTMTGSSAGIESTSLVLDRAVLGLGLEVWRDGSKHPKRRVVTSDITMVALAEKPELAEQLRREAKALA